MFFTRSKLLRNQWNGIIFESVSMAYGPGRGGERNGLSLGIGEDDNMNQ